MWPTFAWRKSSRVLSHNLAKIFIFENTANNFSNNGANLVKIFYYKVTLLPNNVM